ncbi:DUF72 domain-containing protein [Chitinophaga arvensicola]|uniref:Uncharacterized conserved protein YecE, DUF72 family n=1 Tax=Chitinophaga arvensicola TaxID=29529 RepID=A0A1I0SBW8_9BACT|nr:DUF72 domain-containing protein [Chitinophaga arvensicola]SEW54377.1 Uncharacterized conserved protein YecE, DUF72 family [Chitinophaga arvensicola]
MATTGIHIGTSGWSYRHWREIFYPKELKPTDYLSWYAKTFKVTEINTSFYHLPRLSTVEGWIEKVPARFYFCPKISRYVTHVKRLTDPEESLPKFFDLFNPFKKHLGPVLLQLPPSAAFEADRADHFFQVLTKNYGDYHFALEARHKSWLSEEATAMLQQYKIAWVIALSGNRWPYAETITAKHIYLRFHGPNGRYDALYPEKLITEYAGKIKEWQQDKHTVWAFFNNDGHGYALQNAQQLITLLK